MSENFKLEEIRKGQNLQYMAQTYYGNIYGWPLVWYFNKAAIPNPENVPVGTRLRIPRLDPRAELKDARAALEAAYMLVYKAYASQKIFSDGQRRWVLTQAGAAGIQIGGENFRSVLIPNDAQWAGLKTLKIAADVQAPSLVLIAEKDTSEIVRIAALSDEKKIEHQLETYLALGKLDDIIGDLEVEATKSDSKPGVHFALALAYGRNRNY